MHKQQTDNNWEKIRILVLSASLRKDSYNTRLARLAANAINNKGGLADFAGMAEFDCVSFNQDLEADHLYPQEALEFKNRILESDAILIASPEYNGSMPGSLKNAIDWVSRFRPQPLNNRHALLMSASTSVRGGYHGLWSLRIPLEKLGSHVSPSMFSLATAHNAFTPEGNISDAMLTRRFEDTLAAFMNIVEASKHYPLLKKYREELR